MDCWRWVESKDGECGAVYCSRIMSRPIITLNNQTRRLSGLNGLFTREVFARGRFVRTQELTVGPQRDYHDGNTLSW